jgi:hypothetical protein
MSTETLPLAASTLASRLPGRLDNSAARKLGVALVAVTIFAIWLLSGVTLATVVRFVAFECLFVMMPGCVLVALLFRDHAGWYRTVAIGWPLGYVIAIGAYALSAAIHARQLFVLLPVLVVSTAVVRVLLDRARHRAWRWNLIGSRHSFPTDGRDRQIVLLTTALVVSIALVFLACHFFPIYPLPERASSVAYQSDTVSDISLAAEARHHWPLTAPSVAGQPLRYYTGVFIYAAAVNQVTRIPLATIFLRLLPPVIMILVSLQLMLLAGRRRESIWVGSIAVILFLLVSELNLDATRFEVFGTTLTNTIVGSPTYGLGIPLFLALLVIMRRQLVGDDDDDARSSVITRQQRIGAGLVVMALLLGLGATKTSAAADLLGGLALYSIWRYATARPERVLIAYLALSAAAVTIIYVTMLAGGTASTLHLGPFKFLHETIFVSALRSPLIVRLVSVPAAAVASCFFLCAPLFAAGWLLRRRDDDVPMAGLLLSIFVCSLGAYLLLTAPSGGQGYFMVYGYIAMLPLAATGLTRLWSELGQSGRRRMGWACLVTLVLGLALAASSRLTATLAGISRPTGSMGYYLAWLAWYAVAYGLAAGMLLRMSIGLERSLAPAVRRRAVRIAACSIPLLSTLGAVRVLGVAGPDIANTILQRRSVEVNSASDRGITAALYRGLIWVRDHTSPCAVIAVNNHYIDAAMKVPRYLYYSAFTERNVYLESWGYTVGGESGQKDPFPRRLALNDAATIAGSATALRGLRREGVSYILIDKTHGPDPSEPADLARLVFQNSALDVYLIAPRTGSEPAACAE